MSYLKTNKHYKGSLEFLFAKISANSIHFFNEFSLDEHRNILLRHLSYKKASYNRFINTQEYIGDLNPNEETINAIEKSSIIYSYCIEEYRMIPVLLNRLGHNVAILMKGRIKQQQVDLFRELENYLNSGITSRKPKIQFISSDENNVIGLPI